jgi:toxin ParE1/3/4
LTRRVVFSPEARNDLFELYDYIADRSGAERALPFTERIARFCEALADFPERGTRRDELRPGLRTIGFSRRVTIGFHVTDDRVVVDRILYGGRDLGRAFGDDGL